MPELLPPPDDPPPDGMLAPPEDPPPELPLGMLELLPPPELPPEDPDEPDEPDEPPGDEGLGMLGEGMLEEEDCCAQPPIRKAETEPTRVVCTAMTSSRRRVGLWDIAFSPVRVRITERSQIIWLTVTARREGNTQNLRPRS